MADWPQTHQSGISLHYPTGSGLDNLRMTVTGGAANTKGSWTEIVSSTPYDVCAIYLPLNLGHFDTTLDYLIDIGVGASGSEQVIIENLLFSSSESIRDAANPYLLPVSIPAGTRVSIRAQENSGSKSLYTGIQFFYGRHFASVFPTTKIDTYGANTADSGGVEVDPGGSSLTKGSYSEITSSCEEIKGLIIAIGNKKNGSRAEAWFGLDIAIGGSGQEQVIIPNYSLHSYGSTNKVSPSVSPVFPISIPAGTRISARAMSSITDATDRLFDVILYGLR